MFVIFKTPHKICHISSSNLCHRHNHKSWKCFLECDIGLGDMTIVAIISKSDERYHLAHTLTSSDKNWQMSTNDYRWQERMTDKWLTKYLCPQMPLLLHVSVNHLRFLKSPPFCLKYFLCYIFDLFSGIWERRKTASHFFTRAITNIHHALNICWTRTLNSGRDVTVEVSCG